MAVEYTSGQEESIDSLTEEELKGLIQVNRKAVLLYEVFFYKCQIDLPGAFLTPKPLSFSFYAVAKSYNAVVRDLTGSQCLALQYAEILKLHLLWISLCVYFK